MQTTLRTVTLAAALLSMMFSAACTRTRTVTRYVPVVTPVERCPVSAPDLPPLPTRMTCSQEGVEVCFSQAEAWRLAALLEVLTDVYQDVKACAVTP